MNDPPEPPGGASDAALLGTVLVGDFLPAPQALFLLALGAVAGLLGAILSVRREAGR